LQSHDLLIASIRFLFLVRFIQNVIHLILCPFFSQGSWQGEQQLLFWYSDSPCGIEILKALIKLEIPHDCMKRAISVCIIWSWMGTSRCHQHLRKHQNRIIRLSFHTNLKTCLGDWQCLHNFSFSIWSAAENLSQSQVRANSRDVLCPDGIGCPNGTTCCKELTGLYGCCQFPDVGYTFLMCV